MLFPEYQIEYLDQQKLTLIQEQPSSLLSENGPLPMIQLLNLISSIQNNDLKAKLTLLGAANNKKIAAIVQMNIYIQSLTLLSHVTIVAASALADYFKI